MTVFLLAAGGAFWLGVLTSISPCPLATNLAAISYVGQNVRSAPGALLSGLAYSVGRALTYAAIGALVVAGLFSVPGLSNTLQRTMNQVLGPVLILVGMYLLGLFSFRFSSRAGNAGLWERLAKARLPGALVLGILFALSFCPVSAALYFGSLIPLAIQHRSPWLLPAIYGLGTGLPVFLLAGLIATGGYALGKALDRLHAVERYARLGTGFVLVSIGLYLSVRFIFLA